MAGRKATIFVEGDAYITENIVNESPGGWNDRSEIGYLLIVARGNIYVDPGVERIDAVLVAYPRTGGLSGGEIWTCWEPGRMDSLRHFDACSQHYLVVNGALVARKLRLGRIVDSVIAASAPDRPTAVLPDNRLDTFNRLQGSYNRASEEISLRPEFLIGIPELPLFPDQIYKSDSISVVPINY